jgi:DNA polymerase-4
MAVEIPGEDYDKAMEFGRSVKAEIKAKIGLPCTIGISTSVTYAKMVCDSVKPDGIGIVKKEELEEFLANKDVGSILGVGGKTKEKLNAMGVYKISDLAKRRPLALMENFGKFGAELARVAAGEDIGGIVDNTGVISIGRERTIDNETNDLNVVSKVIEGLAKETFADLNAKNLWFRTVGAKVRYTDFSFRTKVRKLPNYTDSYDLAVATCMELMKDLIHERKVRKVGIRLTDLQSKKGQKKIF